MAGRYPSKAVANWILTRFVKDKRPITQLQLQKLAFIAHGWHLATDPDCDGLLAESVKAWKYGPVFPSLREEFADCGSAPITRLANDWMWDDQFVTPSLDEYDPEDWEIRLLEWVYKRYGGFSGAKLIDITHRTGTPWYNATKGGTDIPQNLTIPNEDIRKFYVKLLKSVSHE